MTTKKGTYFPGNFTLKVIRSYAGLGLKTLSPIPKGACVIEYIGRTLTKEETETSKSRYLFEISSRKTIDGTDRKNTARYINHSCKPNCEAVIHNGRVFIMARRNIKPDEELTYDYGKEYVEEFIQPCRCGHCS